MADARQIGQLLIADLAATFGAVAVKDVHELTEVIASAPRVFVDGKGRSGLQARGFAMRLMHLGLSVHCVGDVTTPAIGERDLLLIASGSGRTPSVVQHAAAARARQATIALISATRTSEIAAMAHHVVVIPASTPKAPDAVGPVAPLQPMGSLFEQTLSLVFEIMVILLMHRRNLTSEQMFLKHANLE